MWARVVEAMFGCWLAASPFIFGLGPADTRLIVLHFAAAAAIFSLSLVSYSRIGRHARFVTLLIACLLIAYGRMAPDAGPAHENLIFVGLLLLLFTIVPNHASLPPDSWRQAEEAALRPQSER